MKIFIEKVRTPAGTLSIAATGRFVIAACFGNTMTATLSRISKHSHDDFELVQSENKVTNAAVKELKRYFEGDLKKFVVPIKLIGTAFQLKSWRALRQIQFGKTISYGEQASMVGNSKASRAVGGANGKNPICVIVPCHRVIAQDGGIGGYTGGLEIKRKLLSIEGVSLEKV